MFVRDTSAGRDWFLRFINAYQLVSGASTAEEIATASQALHDLISSLPPSRSRLELLLIASLSVEFVTCHVLARGVTCVRCAQAASTRGAARRGSTTARPTRDGRQMDGRAVRALTFMLERSSCEGLSVKEVAREVGLSEWYLQRLLKVATGVTFRHQLRQIRVNAAQTLLMNKNMSIKEIAFVVGYRSTSILDRNFRSVVGMCPADYRVARFGQRSHEIASKRS